MVSRRRVVGGLVSILLISFFLLDFLRAREGQESLIPWRGNALLKSIQIDRAVNRALIGLGITTDDRLHERTKERMEEGMEWIHFTKRVRVTSQSLESCYQEIKKAVEEMGGKVLGKDESKDALRMEIGFGSLPTCLLTLQKEPLPEEGP